jgi:hypothetical protein
MLISTLFSLSADLSLVDVRLEHEGLTLVVRSSQTKAACPKCTQPSTHVHGHYTRRLADLPCQKRPVRVCLEVHRFACRTKGCLRTTFAERFPLLTRAYARRTLRQAEALTDITKEMAAVVLAQIKWVKRHYTAADNPNGWLFPASKMSILSGKSLRFQRGDPRSGKGLNLALNNLARKYQIQDDQGKIFHFRLHAFRHTKAVELINNGMSLVMVQQWMAHASPEMTLIPTFRSFKKTKNRIVGRQGQASGGSFDGEVADVKSGSGKSSPHEYGAVQCLQSTEKREPHGRLVCRLVNLVGNGLLALLQALAQSLFSETIDQ